MSLTDKDILITPNRGQVADPRIDFKGASSVLGPQVISLNVYPTNNGTVSFDGSVGQLLSMNNANTGPIFSVNDVSGMPSIEILDTGEIRMAQYSGFVKIPNSTSSTNSTSGALQVTGGVGIGGNLNVAGTITGSFSLPAGVANGVLYNNASNVITSGSVLTFDGTNFALNGSSRLSQLLGGAGIQMQNAAATANWFIATSSLNLSFTSAQNGAALWSINGSEQMRLTSTGLGIGTSSPVNYGSGYVTLGLNGSVAGVLDLMANGVSQLRVFGNAYENRLQGVTSVPLTFYTNNIEQMRLDISGNLTLGTATSDGSRVYAYADLAAAFTGFSVGNNSLSASASAEIQLGTQGGSWRIQNLRSGGALAFYFGVERARFDNAGNLGIGTSSPGAKLDLNGAAGVGIQIFETSTGTNKRLRVTQESAYVKYDATYSTVGNAHSWWVGGSRYMDLDVSGNLGIGTTTPRAALHVMSGVRSISIAADNAGIGGASYLIMGNSDSGGTAGPVVIASANRALQFGVGTSFTSNTGGTFTEYARFDSSGNFGIGTSSPVGKLDSRGAAYLGADSNNSFYVDSTSSLVTIGAAGRSSFSTSALRFLTSDGTAAIERMRLDSSGNLGIGASSVQGALNIERSSSSGTIASIASIILSNRNSTSGTYVTSGIFSNTYRDITTSSYTAGVWFERQNSADAGALASDGSIIFGANSYADSGTMPTERMRINSKGSIIYGFNTAVSAAGTTQGTATAVYVPVNFITSCTAGSADGVILPAANTTVGSIRLILINRTTSICKVYPSSGQTINSANSNAPFLLSPGQKVEFISGSNSWHTNVDITLTVRDFGAVGNGSNDDTSAIQAALNTGEHIHIPQGTYLITSNLSVTKSGTMVTGDGNLSRIVTNSLTADIFTIGDGTNEITGLHFANFVVWSTVAKTGGYAFNCRFLTSSDFENMFLGSNQLYAAGGHRLYYGYYFDRFDTINVMAGQVVTYNDGLRCRGNSNDSYSAELVVDGGIRFFYQNATGAAGIRIGGNAGGVYLRRGDVSLAYYGVVISLDLAINPSPAVGRNREIFIEGFNVDTCISWGFIQTTDSVAILSMDKPWLASSGTNDTGPGGCLLQGGTTVTPFVSISNPFCYNNRGSGLAIAGRGYYTISGGEFVLNGRRAGGGHGIEVVNNDGRTSIVGAQVGINGQVANGWGIVVISSDNFIIADNNLYSNAQGNLSNSSGLSANKVIVNNIGYWNPASAPSSTDILSTSTTNIGGIGGNYLTLGQYSNGYQWIQSSYLNPTTAIYPIILQPLGGNVGIGTTTPGAVLEVNGNARATNYYLQTSNTTSAASYGFENSNGPYIQFWGSASGNSGSLLLFTAGSEKMRITSGGNVGIGTGNPGAALEVIGSARAYNYFPQSSLTSSSATYGFENSNGPQLLFYGSATGNSGALVMTTAGTEKLRLTSAGSLGLSNGNPAARLDVSQENSFNATTPGTLTNYGIHLSGQATANYATGITFSAGQATASNANAGIYSQGSGSYGTKMYFATTNSYATGAITRMMIDNLGNVGIGTTSPIDNSGYKTLTIQGSSGGVIELSTDGSLFGRMYISSGDSSMTVGNQKNGALTFITNGSGRVTISAGGTFTCGGIYSTTVGGTNRAVYVDSGGLVGYVSSVRASKANINEITDTSWLLQLNPVSFNYRKKDAQQQYTDEVDASVEYGLIAEEVEPINSNLCFYDEIDGQLELKGISYDKLIAPMLKLIQEQQQTINELSQRITQLELKN